MVALSPWPRNLSGRLAKLTARFCRRCEGATAVEFALIAVPFFLVIMATVQTAIVYMAQQECYILTEQATNFTQAQFAQTVCNQVSALFNCSGLMINVQNYGTGTSFSSATTTAPTLTFDSKGKVSNTWTFSPGTNGSIVVVQVMYQWPIYLKPFNFNLSNLSNGNRLLMATAVFRNEPL